ncbi:MAG: class A beta-lactamase [Thermoanaerobaculia bacterium]
MSSPLTLALALALAATLTTSPASPLAAGEAPGDPSLTKLGAEVDRISRKAHGVVGVRAVHLESGRAFSRNATVRFPMQSTFKEAVAITVLQQVEDGKLKLDQPVSVTENDLRPGLGSETLTKCWKPGATFTVNELTDFMITESDNTATDLLMRMLGGPSAVQAQLTKLGLAGIDVSRTEQRMNLDYHGVKELPAEGACSIACMKRLTAAVPRAEQDRARLAYESDPRDTATPEAMATLNARLMKGELLSKGSTERLLDLLRRCKTGKNRIRALLPSGTEVFNKTGTGGRSTNDVGIVTLPGGSHVALSVYVKASTQEGKQRERVIAEIARAVYQTFSAAPTAAAAGRS